MLAVVLAAGSGSRLRPLTDTRSKPMLPIAGKPMVERVMERLADEGAETFVVVVHPEDEALLDQLRQPEWRDRVQLTTQESRTGMADAVACAAPLVRREGVEEFLLASCDNVFSKGHIAALAAYRRAHDLDTALTLMRVGPDEVSSLAVVEMEGERITNIIEKPSPEEAPSDLGSVALYALTPSILDHLDRVPVSQRGEREFPDAVRLLIQEGGRVGGLVTEHRMTLTRPRDLLALNRHFLDESSGTVVETDLPSDTAVVAPARIERGACVEPGCRIGPQVYLEAGCRVGTGASLERTVVLRGAAVAAGADIQDSIIHH